MIRTPLEVTGVSSTLEDSGIPSSDYLLIGNGGEDAFFGNALSMADAIGAAATASMAARKPTASYGDAFTMARSARGGDSRLRKGRGQSAVTIGWTAVRSGPAVRRYPGTGASVGDDRLNGGSAELHACDFVFP